MIARLLLLLVVFSGICYALYLAPKPWRKNVLAEVRHIWIFMFVVLTVLLLLIGGALWL